MSLDINIEFFKWSKQDISMFTWQITVIIDLIVDIGEFNNTRSISINKQMN